MNPCPAAGPPPPPSFLAFLPLSMLCNRLILSICTGQLSLIVEVTMKVVGVAIVGKDLECLK